MTETITEEKALTAEDIDAMNLDECRAALKRYLPEVAEARAALMVRQGAGKGREKAIALVDLLFEHPEMTRLEVMRAAGYSPGNGYIASNKFREILAQPDVKAYLLARAASDDGYKAVQAERATERTEQNWQVDPLDFRDPETGEFRLEIAPEASRRSVETFETKTVQLPATCKHCGKDLGKQPTTITKIGFFKAMSQSNYHRAIGLATMRLANPDGSKLSGTTLVFMPQPQGLEEEPIDVEPEREDGNREATAPREAATPALPLPLP